MNFEWDSVKAEINRRKHGVSFEESATVFLDPNGLDISDLKHSTSREVRAIRLGDRIVHHSVIAEFDVTSYRTAQAQRQVAEEKKPAAKRRRAKN